MHPCTASALLALACLVAPAVAQPPVDSTVEPRPLADVGNGVVAAKDVEYARVGEQTLMLDVYYTPQQATAGDVVPESRPLIVWVHGGGWRNGSKDRCPATRFAAQGYVVASIDYRLSGVAKFPAQIHDCKAAIRFLRKHAARYAIDPERVGVWGSSAGGHLAALLGTSGDVKKLEGDVGVTGGSSAVQCVVDFYGPTDLLQMDAHALPNAPFAHDSADSPEARLIGGPIQDNPAKVAELNPLTYVTRNDPPFLICHGDEDPLVPLHQSELLHAALEKAGVAATLHVVEGGGHGWGRKPEVDRLVEQFLAKHLKATK
jgi:acetyl esterase/lipase